MTELFGRPRVAIEQTKRGTKDDALVYLALETEVRLLVRVPDHLAVPDAEMEDDGWEERLRGVVADALVGLESGGFRVDTSAVARFVDGGA